MQDKNRNDSGHQQILNYIQGRIDNKKRAEGRIVSDEDRIYVLYVRKSTKGKDKNGKARQEKSIDDQIGECRKNVISKMEDKPVQTFRTTSELGSSREAVDGIPLFREEQSAKKSGKRDEFRVMMKGIKDRKYNSIIAYHPDRLARNMKEAGEIMDFLDQGLIADLQFATYTFNNDENGKLALGIQFALAKYYSDHLSTSSSRGSRGQAQLGKSPNNKPRFGYKLVKKLSRPDGNNFQLLRVGFQMGLSGVSLTKIADYLNENKFSYTNKITKMDKQKVSKIFNDPFYAGTYQYGELIVDLGVDPKFVPMITEAEFLQLRNVMEKPHPIQKKEHSVVLFRDIVFCGHCHQLVQPALPKSGGKSQIQYASFYCHRKKCSSHDLGNKPGFRSKIIFNFLDELLKNGVRADKKGYEIYKNDILEEVAAQKSKFENRLKQLPLDMKRSDSATKILSNALSKAKTEKVEQKLNKDLAIELDVQESLRTETTTLANNIRSLDNQFVTYEQFCNTFNYLPDIIEHNDDPHFVYTAIRILFSKFIVKNNEVISYELNPKYMLTINSK